MSKKIVKAKETAAAQDPKTILQEVLDKLRESSDAAGDRAEEALQEAAQTIAKAAKALEKESTRLAKKAGKGIKEHPVAATAIAAAAVGLVGLMVAQKVKKGRDK